MIDRVIWILIALVSGLWLGFLLATVLAFGSIRRWRSAGNEYRSGRVTALQEMYRFVSERQKKERGDSWCVLEDVLNAIGAMLPEE